MADDFLLGLHEDEVADDGGGHVGQFVINDGLAVTQTEIGGESLRGECIADATGFGGVGVPDEQGIPPDVVIVLLHGVEGSIQGGILPGGCGFYERCFKDIVRSVRAACTDWLPGYGPLHLRTRAYYGQLSE